MGVGVVVLGFVVVVIGGLGSLEGALIGAVMVGLVREAGVTFFPEIELAVLYLMAAVLPLIPPAGILGRAGAPPRRRARGSPGRCPCWPRWSCPGAVLRPS